MILDRDARVAQRSQIQFGAIEPQPHENAMDQLSAEMERVLERRSRFNGEIPSLEEIKHSNEEVKRILGNMNKARMLENHLTY